MRSSRLTPLALVAALALAPAAGARLAAQARPASRLASLPADPVAAADSMVAAGDSAGALQLLERAVRADRKNARLWHRRGVIAWGMSRAGRSNSFMKAEHIRRITLADSALRTAAWLAPDSGRFTLDLARFYLNSSLTTLRMQAAGLFERAIDAGRRAGDSLLVAEAADEIGLVEPAGKRGRAPLHTVASAPVP